MNEINIINANFTNGRETVTRKIFQYDYGQKLKIKGINLPFIFQAHISNQKQNGTAKKVIGENNEISIPDEYLISGQDIYIFIVLHQAVDDGETRYLIKIPVIKRSKSSDQQPTPVQQDVIEKAISTLNNAIIATEQNVKHYPKIIDNYWYVYDAQSQEYVNTNIYAYGIQGQQGQSAYQVAVKNGYQGTEEEWLSFLHGENGYTPIRGIDYWTEEDQNEINTYITNQIQDVQNDLEELKIVDIGQESIENYNINTSYTYYYNEDQEKYKKIQAIGAHGIQNNYGYVFLPIEENSKYKIQTYIGDYGTSTSLKTYAVIILNISEISSEISKDNVIEVLGEDPVFNQIVTMPENAKSIIINNVDLQNHPISIAKQYYIKIDRLIDNNFATMTDLQTKINNSDIASNTEVQNMLYETFEDTLTQSDYEELLDLVTNIENEVF